MPRIMKGMSIKGKKKERESVKIVNRGKSVLERSQVSAYRKAKRDLWEGMPKGREFKSEITDWEKRKKRKITI